MARQTKAWRATLFYIPLVYNQIYVEQLGGESVLGGWFTWTGGS